MRIFFLFFFFFLLYAFIAPVDAYNDQDIDNVLNNTKYLSAYIGERTAGTIGEQEAALYIYTKLKDRGLDVSIQNFSGSSRQGEIIKLEDGKNENQLLKKEEQKNKTIISQNIIGRKQGISDKIILLTAHYDSYGGPGANDNAAGVGVILQLAKTLQNQSTNNSIWFIFFGAEEAGTLGSNKFLESLSENEKKNILAVINVDTIGVGDALEPEIFSTRGGNLVQTPPWLLKILLNEANKQKSNIKINTIDINEVMLGKPFFDENPRKSDFAVFLTMAVPAIGIGYNDEKLGYIPYEYIHSKNDTFDKINRTNIGEINEIVLGMVENIDMNDYFDHNSNEKYFLVGMSGNLLIMPTNQAYFSLIVIGLVISIVCFTIYCKLSSKRRIEFLICLSSLTIIVSSFIISRNLVGWMGTLFLLPLLLNIIGLVRKSRNFFLISSILLILVFLVFIKDALFRYNQINYFEIFIMSTLLVPALIQLVPKYDLIEN